MAVLIAIEIFVSIIRYLRSNVIYVKVVMATVLMAITRKIIIPDYNERALGRPGRCGRRGRCRSTSWSPCSPDCCCCCAPRWHWRWPALRSVDSARSASSAHRKPASFVMPHLGRARLDGGRRRPRALDPGTIVPTDPRV